MSDKPESPIADTVLSNPLNPFSKRVGRTTEIFSYRTTIDGESVFVIESVELDLNGNTGATKGISLSGNDRFKGSIDSLSKEDKELVSGALTNNSVRDEAYKKRMLEVRKKAEKNGKLEEFDAALEKNGNLEAITGNGSFSESGPETTKDRNNAKIKAEDDAEKARLEEFKKSIEVSDKDHKYPIDMKSDDGQDYVYFEQFEYLPPQNTKRSGDKETLNNEIGQTLKQGVGRGRNTKVRHGSCKLPIPNKLGVSNGVNWGEGRANAVELSAFQSADRGIQELITKGNVLKAIGGAKDQVGDALNVVRGDLSGRTERSGENISAGDVLSATLARSVLGTIGINVDVDQFITRQTGAAINPNLELLFGGPQLQLCSK